MSRFWVSWWTGNYEDEGCTTPPFNYWTTGQRSRVNDGLTEDQLKTLSSLWVEEDYDNFIDKFAKDDCSICAVIDAENEDAVWDLVEKYFPDYEQRFAEIKPDDYTPGSRFT